jgi:hypothetical protein
MNSIAIKSLWVCLVSMAWPMMVFSQNVSEPRPIKFDAYHSHTWLDTLPQPGLTNYHLLHGPARAANALVELGWNVEVQLSPLNTESLAQASAVVFNLVSADRPPFLVSEIEAIRSYVEDGGGLLFITDHTNCYFHNHVLGALMERLGIELRSDLACDVAPYTLSGGNGWIVASSFRDHPITRSLQHIAFQSGGCVDPAFGIAWTSRGSWADSAIVPAYGENRSLGFYGDMLRQSQESSGPQPIVGAREFGKGRIAIVADQNCVGGMFLNYSDNRRLWLQMVDWVSGANLQSGRDELIERQLASAERDRSLVWCMEDLAEMKYAFGNDGHLGMYNWYAWLNKCADARGTSRRLMQADFATLPNIEMLGRGDWKSIVTEFVAQPSKTLILIGDEHGNEAIDAMADSNGWRVLEEASLPGRGRCWSVPNGSVVFLYLDGNLVVNSQFPVPEAEPSEAVKQLQEKWENWFIARGMNPVPHFGQQASWLEEMDAKE